MSKLSVLRPREVIKKFERLGFAKDRQAGSHVVLYHQKDKRRAVIPLHVKDLAKGTLSAILRESKVSREEFLKA